MSLTKTTDMFVRDIQLRLSYIFLRLNNRSVWQLQILESILDLGNPIYSFQLEDHKPCLALCATLHTSDTQV
jgi:hypothetical protein